MAPFSNISYEERKLIEKLKNEGLSKKKIGGLINRSQNGLRREFMRCAAFKYNADEAQRDFERKKKERVNNLIKAIKEKPPKLKFMKRIECLEMQVELLYNKLKELINK